MKKKLTHKRRKNDAYYTEPWTIDELLKEWHIGETVWEPAAGRGDLVKRLRRKKRKVYASDIQLHKNFRLSARMDFLKFPFLPGSATAIITNPPYKTKLCEAFIRRALSFMKPGGVKTVAMLLPTAWGNNSAGRRDLFDYPFACKLELTRRIRFIDNTTERPKGLHAWFIWDRDHVGQAYHKVQRGK